MKKKIIFLALFIAFLCSKSLFGQMDFLEHYEFINPTFKDISCTFEEKLNIHENFLQKAIAEKNTLHELYGYMYISNDYVMNNNYVNALKYLLKAEKLSIDVNNQKWIGRVKLYIGSVYADLYDTETSMKYFKESLTLSESVADSQNMAMALEQIGAIYALSEEYDKAEEYYQLAMPLEKKYCDKSIQAITLDNYGSLLVYQGKLTESIPYTERAIALADSMNSHYIKFNTMNNLASTYLDLNQLDKAMKLWDECITEGKDRNWADLLLVNYLGKSEVFEKQGNWKKAHEYFKKYHEIEDSIIGRQVKRDMAELQTKYLTQQKDLEIKKKELLLNKAQQTIMRYVTITIITLLIIIFGIWVWYIQSKNNKQVIKKNQANLNTVIQLLGKKNSHIQGLEEQVSQLIQKQSIKSNTNANTSERQNGEVDTFYNKKILTDDDWTLFKSNFEESYPNYMFKLRTKHSALSEAEERLFLLIKLHLSSKEIADILGITRASVKKTRHRLRRRLKMEESDSLDEYIYSF